MTTAEQKQDKLKELKWASAAMYLEYLKHRDSDKQQADYAWEQYQAFERQVEQMESIVPQSDSETPERARWHEPKYTRSGSEPATDENGKQYFFE